MSRRYGSRYDQSMSTADIGKAIKASIKQTFPWMKRVSVRTDVYSSGTGSIRIECYVPFKAYDDARRTLTPQARTVFNAVSKIANDFNFNGSDVLTDYYDVKFYVDVVLRESA